MAKLYGNEIYAISLRETDKTLFSVLTDNKMPCVVSRMTGIDITCVDYDLSWLMRPLSGGVRKVSEEDLKRIKSGRICKEEFAVSYVKAFTNPPRIIMDHSHNRHFNINPEEKRILVIKRDFKLLFCTPIVRQFGDYIYDGSLLDALNEFKERGYKFYETKEIDWKPQLTREIIKLEELVS